MPIFLLVIIYLVFVSLGLPDGVLGGAWPSIQSSFNAPLPTGGYIALVITFMTIVSSLATAYLVKRLGTGKLITISTALTALSLLGFSQAVSIEWLFLLAVPLGLGAGAIDSALNNYVANHYDAHHMNWLHACWGIGATAGPILFATSLASSGDWHSGYLTLWAKVKPRKATEAQSENDFSDIKFSLLIKQRPVLLSFISFLLYQGIEVGIGLWIASYLVSVQSMALETAALWTGVYYGAITLGRIGTGLISMKVSSKQMIRFGLLISICGAILLSIDIHSIASFVGIGLIGLGFAPIYPSMIHATPERFGANKSAKIMSLQMVGGYTGASLIPPIIGITSGVFSMAVFAFIVPATLLLLVVSTELMNRLLTRDLA
ncbi:MAG: MFS transporter [Chloroflexi bacterium]|nr:MAG: MFS transporter [Chloroflexota bacterium]